MSFGYNPSRNNWFFSDGASDNQAWDNAIAVADVGRITDINAYFGGDVSTCTGGPVLWSAGGSVVQYTSHSVARGSRASNGGFTVTTSGLDITFSNPTTYFVGAFRNSADSWITPFADGIGAYGFLKTVAGTSPGASSGGSTWLSQSGFTGGVTAYANYFSGQVYVRRSGAWKKVQVEVRRGGWTTPKIYVQRGGSWTQVDIVALDWKKEFECIVEWFKGSWEKALFRWDYDLGPKTFGRTPSGILLTGEYT